MKRAWVIAAALALSACQSATASSPAASSSSESPGLDLGEGIHLAISKPAKTVESADPGCAEEIWEFKAPGGEYQAVLLKPGCVATKEVPENGNHGFYPEPPAAAVVDQAETPVGQAQVFSNQYAICGDSCYVGTDEVAVVKVGDRVVQVIATSAPASGTSERDRAALIAVLQGLSTT